MSYRFRSGLSEAERKRSLHQRMVIVHCFLLIILLTIVARLIELQVVQGKAYQQVAEDRHYRKVAVPAKRGEIFGISSKTGETNIFATNTTLDMVYVDPLITDDPAFVADTLAGILLTDAVHQLCTHGSPDCPRELITLYAAAFDPVMQHKLLGSGALLEPLPPGSLPPTLLKLPDIIEARRQFAEFIRRRISEKRVTYAPIKYGATKVDMSAIEALHVPGVTVTRDESLIWANPQDVPQSSIANYAFGISKALKMDAASVADLLTSRPLRYVPVMRRLPPDVSLKVKEAQLASLKQAMAAAAQSTKKSESADFKYPLRSVALLAEHWRYYPDTTIASHVIGFVNAVQEPQYGVERTFNPQLRGREGIINTVNDPQGGQILTSEQTIINPQDGDSVVLTLDRTVQKKLESLMQDAIQKYQADSGQAIVMDPYTGRIIAMVNVPLFDSNNYGDVFQKEVIMLRPDQQQNIVVELYDPDTNALIIRDYQEHIFTASGRNLLTEKRRKALEQLETLYDLKDLSRYYYYVNQSNSIEVFPTSTPGVWLKYKNDIGVGAYLNRSIQEIYEPGSVMKPITMAIAIDQGEITPDTIYDDTGPVQVDEYTIKNALLTYYGKVTMTNCLAYSINTCLTSVGFRLGPKLFSEYLDRFGFGKITGIELEDELPGEVRPWREWSRSLLANSAFGQGFSVTPLQMTAAWAAIANGGKLVKPTIIDSVIHPDGTVEKTQPKVLDQVISPQTAQTVTAMLVNSTVYGFAKAGKVKGYRIAAKTGTSQIAGPGGKYTQGSGSTVATYAGYAPPDHPKFLVLVKLDRPKNTVYGVVAAAPVFQQIAQFMFDYYGIPPDETASR